MGNLSPGMAPRRASQALRWCEDVCEGASILTWEPLPLPDGFGWGPCGDAIPDGDAWGRRALEVQPVGVGAVSFSPRASACWSRVVGGWLNPDRCSQPLSPYTGPASGPQSSSQMVGRRGRRAVCSERASHNRTSRQRWAATEALRDLSLRVLVRVKPSSRKKKTLRRRTVDVPTIQDRGSKGQGWLPLKRKIGKAGSAPRPRAATFPDVGDNWKQATGLQSVGATASPVATSLPVAVRPTPCKRVHLQHHPHPRGPGVQPWRWWAARGWAAKTYGRGDSGLPCATPEKMGKGAVRQP
jgi:hypothetical protein